MERGNPVGQTLTNNWDECKKQCDDINDSCHSIVYCWKTRDCLMYDKKLAASDPVSQADANACYSYYRKCHGSSAVIKLII